MRNVFWGRFRGVLDVAKWLPPSALRTIVLMEQPSHEYRQRSWFWPRKMRHRNSHDATHRPILLGLRPTPSAVSNDRLQSDQQ